MLSLFKYIDTLTWEEARIRIRQDFEQIESTVNIAFETLFGEARHSAIQIAYPLGGSLATPVPQSATAGAFVDANDAIDVPLPAHLPPGPIKAYVRCHAALAGVGTTPRIIRTDTRVPVGTGTKFITTALVTWSTVVEFTITPVIISPGQTIYYRLQLASDTANSDVYGIGLLVTGR